MKKITPSKIKKALLFFGILLICSIVFWPNNNHKNHKEVGKKIQKRQVYNFDYHSKDKGGSPFVLYAKKAVNTEKKNVQLIDVHLVFYRSKDDLVHSYSNKAFVDREKNIITFNGNVRVVMSDGHEFKTEKAKYEIDERVLSGSLSIKGSGPAGFIDGIGFVIYNKTRKFVIYKVNPMTLKKAEADKK